MARPTMGRTVRVIALTLCVAAMVVPGAAIIRQSWQVNADSTAVVDAERAGAAMLTPTIALLAHVVNAQSVAVRGGRVDAAGVREVFARVATVDERYGERLQTRQRVNDLRGHLDAALAHGGGADDLYAAYSGVVALVNDLVRTIGDRSGLILDPRLDSYYLMDAVVLALPDVMMFAGRAADLAQLPGRSGSAGQVAVAVARHAVAVSAEEVSSAIAKSVNATDRAALGSELAQPLDAFRAAVDAFAPPAVLAEFVASADPVNLAATARRVGSTALALAERIVDELDALLRARADELTVAGRFTLAAGGVLGLAGLIILWLLAVVRPREAPADDGPGPEPSDLVGALTSAANLYEAEELVRVGRGVRARPRGDADAA